MQVIQMVKNKKETSGNDLDWEFQVPGQCLPGVVCSRRRTRQWGAEKCERGQVGAISFVEKVLSCFVERNQCLQPRDVRGFRCQEN